MCRPVVAKKVVQMYVIKKVYHKLLMKLCMNRWKPPL